MSERHDRRNELALARLAAAAERLPCEVLQHARSKRYVPALPRLAVESYWRAHPLRADRLARALAARSGQPGGWRWIPGNRVSPGFRQPPTPFREQLYARGPGHCCICGQPVFNLGWHTDFCNKGERNQRAAWHACCVTAWSLWTAPIRFRVLLAKVQRRRCAETGARLLKSAEIDHRTPLFQVWRDHRDMNWPDLLAFWGLPNLQLLSRQAHQAKSNAEAGSRARAASVAAGYPSARVESPDWRFSGRGMPTTLNPAST